MNKQDRKTVADAIAKLNSLREEMDDVATTIRELSETEQGKFDNMSEGLQQGDTGQAIETAANDLADAASSLEEGDLGQGIEKLEAIE